MDQELRFHSILKNFSNAMLITFGQVTAPHARPMRIVEVDEQSNIWFVTDERSVKVDELRMNPKVCLTMQSSSQFLTIHGIATIEHDRRRIQELWNESWKVWFPNGPDDTSIVLLRVDPQMGEFWDMGGLKMLQYAYEAGKAYFTGKELDVASMNMHGTVRLN